VYLALSTQTLISAGTYLAAKRALGELPPMVLVLLRNLGSSACFVLLTALFVRPLLPTKEQWGRVLLLGLVAVPVNQGLFLTGLRYSTPAHGALLYTLTPLFVLLLSMAAGTEKLVPAKVAGLMIALCGASIVVFERSGSNLDGGSFYGDVLILGAVIAWAVYTVLGKPLVAAHGPIAATSWTLISGTVLLLPIGVPPSVQVPYAKLSPVAWGAVAFLIFLTSVVSYLCWYYALRELEPSRVAVFSNLQPVATSIASWFLFGERITGRLLLGGGLVICGVLVTTQVASARWREARPSPAAE
jgi:drug/metabolite transporter (DMT)-like permease